MACSSIPTQDAQSAAVPSEPSLHRLRQDGCREGEICLAYQVTVRLGDCPNWNPAIESALAKAGCAAGVGNPSARCQRRLNKCPKACDICRLLAPGAGPVALQKDLSMGRPLDKARRGQTCPAWAINRNGCGWGNWSSETKVYFDDDLCSDARYVEMLVTTMIHEAIHACVDCGGKGEINDGVEKPECDPGAIERGCMW